MHCGVPHERLVPRSAYGLTEVDKRPAAGRGAMRAVAFLFLVLLVAPLALGVGVGDPMGDQVARYYVAAVETSATPYSMCRDGSGDITGLDVTSVGGVFRMRLLLADLGAALDCPVPVVETTASRFYVLQLDRVGGVGPKEAKLSLLWRDPGVRAPTGGIMFQDGKTAMCDGGSRFVDASTLVMQCPLTGTAGGRTYDLSDAEWFGHARTHVVHGTQASFVALEDDMASGLVRAT